MGIIYFLIVELPIFLPAVAEKIIENYNFIYTKITLPVGLLEQSFQPSAGFWYQNPWLVRIFDLIVCVIISFILTSLVFAIYKAFAHFAW